MIPSQLTRGILARTRSATLGALLIACLSCGGSPETPITPVTPPLTPTVSLSAGVAAIIVPTGTSAVVSVTVARGGGFAGDVTLSAEGVPTAVTVSFSPAILTVGSTSSVVTIAVGSGAVGATSSITLRASGSGVAFSAVTVALTVPPPVVPAIALAAGASTLNLTAGTAGTVPLTVTRSNFRGAVALSIAGVPAGVTANLAPATLADSSTASTLTLSAASTAAAVPATAVTVTASGAGVASQTVTFTLTVAAAVVPGFSLSASPASVSVAAGQSATSTVAIARTGGFAASVTLLVEGAPPGVTAAFSPNPASGTSTMTVNVSAAAGTYNLTVRGSASGQTDRTTALSLTLTPSAGITLSAPGTLSATPGSTVALPISVGRVGNYAGDVSLAVDNLPSGVTASFAPGTLSGGTTTSQLSLVVAANATLSTTTITVRASGAGVATQSAPVALTIAAAQGYSLAATNVTATQGGTGTSTVTLTRSGGFAGAVSLSITGLPAGVAGTFRPVVVTGTTSSLDLDIASTVPAGTYNAGIGIVGTAAGLANVTTPLTLTVVPAAPPIIMLKSTKPVVVENRSVQKTEVNYSIRNGGGGTLVPRVQSRSPGAPWLTDLFVSPTTGGYDLWIKIATTGLTPTSEANSPYRTSAIIAADGAASVQVDITFAKTFDQPSGMAATVVRFHRNSNGLPTDAPPPNLTTTVDLLDPRTNTRLAAEIAGVSPSNGNWLEAPRINANGQLELKVKSFTSPALPSGLLPSGSDLIGQPIRISLKRADAGADCRDLALVLVQDPRCQVFVYYTADPYPRLLLRPWGVQLTQSNATATAAIEVQPGSQGTTLTDIEHLRNDCGNKLTGLPMVTPTAITVTGDLAAIPEDSLFRCTVKLQASYRDAQGVRVGTDSAVLTVTLAKPSTDAITPSHRDLNLVVAAGSSSFSEQVTLYNLGTRTISLRPPQLINSTCLNLLGTPVFTDTDVTLGQGVTRVVSVPVNPQGQIPGAQCSAIQRLSSTSVGVATQDIPIRIRRD